MPEHRYTGEWPPPRLLESIPNWEYALDEEDAPGQDETTIRPQLEQSRIDTGTAFTAAIARQANGQARPAIAAIERGRIESIDVFTDPKTCWSVRFVGGEWQPFDQDWLPADERMPVVPLSDSSVFPLEVETVLPYQNTGSRLAVKIGENP